MISNVDQLIEQANLIENETERVIFVMNYFLQNVRDFSKIKVTLNLDDIVKN